VLSAEIDFGPWIRLEVEPPRRRSLLTGVRGNNDQVVTVSHAGDHRRATLPRLAADRRESQNRLSGGEDERPLQAATAQFQDSGV
jgi:hypothetical protein